MEEVLKWVAPKIYKRETRYLATGDAFSTINELQDRRNDYFQNC